MCVNVFKAGLLICNLHTIKYTLSVNSSMSFDKWIQSCNHTQDIEHFITPGHVLWKIFQKVVGVSFWTSNMAQQALCHHGCASLQGWSSTFLFGCAVGRGGSLGSFQFDTLVDPCLLLRPSGGFLAPCVPVKSGVRNALHSKFSSCRS